MAGHTPLRFLISFIAATIFLMACQPRQPDVGEPTVTAKRNIEMIADDYLEAMLARYPFQATSYAIKGARHDRLFDNSAGALTEWQARQDVWLAGSSTDRTF